MAGIGDLVVTLGMNTKPFAGGVSSARSMLGGFASGIGTIGVGIGSLGAVLGPMALGLAGVVGAVKGIGEVSAAFSDIDRIAKAAESFGITTEEMVGLEHAANLSGVSAETLGKAMQKATRNGTDLGTIADKIAAAETPTQKAKIAFDELGRSGQDLLPLLNSGGDAIRDMMAEGSELGGFSREDAGQVEAANDAISRMQLAFTGVARDIAVSLAPTIEKVAVGVKTLGMWTRDAFTQITPIIEQSGSVIIAVWDGVSSAVMSVFGGLFGTAQTTFADITSFILDAAIMAEFAFQNLGPIATLTWDTIKLGAIGFANDVSFFFTDQIPAAIDWFATNSTNVMLGLLNNYLSIWINLGQNIRDLWTGVLDWISGNGFTFEPTALNEGFQDVFAGLADKIPERELTAMEQKLAGSINASTASLTEGMGTFLQQRRAELLGDGETKPFATTIGDIEGSGADAKKQQDLKGPAALQAGSKEAFSSIFAAMRSKSSDPTTEVAKNTKENADSSKRMEGYLRDIAKREAAEFVAVSF